jgi:5-methyltetrahydropteroyltriglutamate--homocysteine methyltransferase
VVNQKHAADEVREVVGARIDRAVALFGAARVILHPDCGFATFADNPICPADAAERKLAAIAQAAADRRGG